MAMPGPREASSARPDPLELVVVGGCGHVGLPLALSFAETGLRVGIYDIDAQKIDRVRAGEVPFLEDGAQDLLRRVLPTGRLDFDTGPGILCRTDTVVLVIGTPIDEFMNPSTSIFERAVDELAPHMEDGALVVLRSTVYPGTTEYVAARLQSHGLRADVAFCPERVAEGHALEEIRSLPQLIGGVTDPAFERASELFGCLDVEIVRTSPREAELAKLFTNTWRYMKFAIANQFFEMAHRAGVDYDNVLHAIRHNYSRAVDLPGPGAARGLQPRPLPHGSCGHADQRGPAGVHHRDAGGPAAARGTDARHPGHGVQGRLGRPQGLAQLQAAQTGPLPGRPGAVQRSFRRRSLPGAAGHGGPRVGRARHRRPPHAVPRPGPGRARGG